MSAVLSIVLSVSASPLFACWADVPLREILRKNPVIVIGKIIRIDVTAPEKLKDGYGHDTAYIQVSKLLKNTLKDHPIQTGDEIPLSMPSVNNTMKTSIDIRYKKGTNGIWILEKKKGLFWATYPKDFQKPEKEKEITELLSAKTEQCIRLFRQAAESIIKDVLSETPPGDLKTLSGTFKAERDALVQKLTEQVMQKYSEFLTPSEGEASAVLKGVFEDKVNRSKFGIADSGFQSSEFSRGHTSKNFKRSENFFFTLLADHLSRNVIQNKITQGIRLEFAVRVMKGNMLLSKPDENMKKGDWELRIFRRLKGARSEGLLGILLHKGKIVVGSKGQNTKNALGDLTFYEGTLWNPRGWLYSDKNKINKLHSRLRSRR